MIELSKQEFKKVMPLIQDADINTMFAIAVLEEKVEGKVYADNIAMPSSYYIQHPCGMSLLYGKAGNNDFYKMLAPFMLNTQYVREKPERLQVYPPSLSTVLDEILGDNLIKKDPEDHYCTPEERKKVLEYQRINFQFNKNKYVLLKENNLNKNNLINMHNYKMVSTSESIFNQLQKGVVPKFYWNNYEEFIQYGIGFTLLSESGIPLSTAFASFISDKKLEIGIESNREYYEQGFATLVCSELIDYCFMKNLIPVWSCNSTNTGSRMLAKKLGFVEIKRIPYYNLVE